MKTTTKVFSEHKRRKVAGIPVSLLAILLVAGLAAAAIVALGPFSAPVSQTTSAIYAASQVGGNEPAYGKIDPTLGYGVVDHVMIQAWQADDRRVEGQRVQHGLAVRERPGQRCDLGVPGRSLGPNARGREPRAPFSFHIRPLVPTFREPLCPRRFYF